MKKMQEKPLNNEKILKDISPSGKEQPWAEHKLESLTLSDVYISIDERKHVRLKGCGSFLSFKIHKDGSKTLHAMDSCRVRLCPMCGWRRAKKIFAHVRKIVDEAERKKGYSYIFLTLTVKNCTPDALVDTLDTMMKGFNKLNGYKAFKTAVKGWYRGLEITHDVNELISHDMFYGDKSQHIYSRKDYYTKHGLAVGDKNPNFNMYHPHFHVILCVDKSYFTNPKQYINQEDWRGLWQRATGVDYSPNVDVRKVKGNTIQAIAESAKYTVKAGDYIIPDDFDLSIETVRLLDTALHKRRLVAFGGIFKDLHKELNLDDEMDGDLIHVDDNAPSGDDDDTIITYAWHTGYGQYIQ